MSSPYSPYDPNQQQPGTSPPQGGYPPGGYPPQGYAQQGGYPPQGYTPYPQQGGYVPSGPRGYLQGGPVGFAEAVTEAVRNAFNYQARASRSAYWWFALATAIAAVILDILAAALKGPGIAIAVLAYIGVAIVAIPLTVRRLHDQDKSGFWYFIAFVPLIGGIWLFVLTLLPGTPGPNRFG